MIIAQLAAFVESDVYFIRRQQRVLAHTAFEDVHYWQVARSYLGQSLYTTGFFLVDDLLIDCGPPNARRILTPLFKSLTVHRMVLTHHHEDHTGNAGHFVDRGIRPEGHMLLAPSLQQVSRKIPAYRRVVWGRPKPVNLAQLDPFVQSARRGFLIIETPGHSPDHVCLLEEKNRWLFTGDLFLSTYLRYLRDDEDVYAIMRSLRTLIDLRPSVLFCNHRGPVADAESALGKKLAFLETVRDRVLESVRKGQPLQSVAADLFRSDRVMRWFSQGQFSSINLLQAFLKPN